MEDKRLKVALVGCGRISMNHFDAIKQNDHYFELSAVCDVLLERAKEAGERWGVPYFTSFKEMLCQGQYDLITVCTPSGLHPTHGIMGAQKGSHIIVEKPMATSLLSADQLISECDSNNVQLFVVKQNRLNSTLQLVKKAVDKKRFGKIYMATVNVFWQRPQEYYDASPWRGTWGLDGGAFMNQASHYVDMLEWLIGDVEKVYAVTSTMGRKIEAEDTGTAILQFRNGALGNMNVTMLTYPQNLEGSLYILGESGTVVVKGTSVNQISQWQFDSYEPEDDLVSSVNYNPPSVYGFGHTGFYNNVAQVLLYGEKPLTDGREGRKSLEIIEAIYKSSRESREIMLPL